MNYPPLPTFNYGWDTLDVGLAWILWGLAALVAGVLGGVISPLPRRPVPLDRKHLRLMLWKNKYPEFKGRKHK